MNLITYITSNAGISTGSIQSTVALLENDATIPFIARYRKEQTGNLDEVQIEQIQELMNTFKDLSTRRTAILKSIEEQDMLSPQLLKNIEEAKDLKELEDLYLPFKKKRKTRAMAAREAGLEPLAKIIMSQSQLNIEVAANRFVKGNNLSIEDAKQGAKDIIAEWVNEDAYSRAGLRKLYSRSAVLSSKVVKAEANKDNSQKYKQYFEWEEPLKKIPSHRFLALYRAANEGVVRLKIEIEREQAVDLLFRKFIKYPSHPSSTYIEAALEDAFTRLLKPSFQNEFLGEAKKKADEEAIRVFAANLEQLLLAPPLGSKRILAIDPGFKSGCKVVCLNENGELLFNETIFPHPPQKEAGIASKKIKSLVNAYKIEAISIGNGTASRETEDFIKKIRFEKDLSVYVVNEAGASVYSASKIAREEFPNYDVTVRGAVSIGRRLSDPLAELVKIDPKSIGVGQYQHEVDQGRLKEKLDTVVMSCVNRIGVNVNTASRELLSYVSGIGPSLADNILEFRKENEAIASRQEILKVPRLGAKAFEQAAGFLRIKNAHNPLDDSAVHPERYRLVEEIAGDLGLELGELVGNKEAIKKINYEKYVCKDLGLPTLKDIFKELEKPGVDPRKVLKQFEFDPNVKKIEDLEAGMQIPGIVNNITNFGCFVDIGIKESGLIHISKLAKAYVSDVNSIVKLNQQVIVKVLEVDISMKRIQLSLID